MAFVYKVVLPGMRLFRRARHRIRKARNRREINRFRRYCENLPKFVPEPVFVKVGANDGITGDLCADFLLGNTQWKGLLIEPVPYYFDRLKVNFSDSQRFSLEQVAIGAISGEATFYYVDRKVVDSIPDIHPFFEQIGSFDRNLIIKHCSALEPFIIERTVEVYTLSDILKRNGIRDVHFLHIDAEGSDYEVLKSLDLAKQAPLTIFVEHKHLPDAQKTEMVSLLRKHGYSMRDCGKDFFAVNEKANHRLRGRRTAPSANRKGAGLNL